MVARRTCATAGSHAADRRVDGLCGERPAAQSQVAAFRGAVAKLGWTEGKNQEIQVRWSAGDTDKMRTLAKELVGLRPDAIVGQTTPVSVALARESRQFRLCWRA